MANSALHRRQFLRNSLAAATALPLSGTNLFSADQKTPEVPAHLKLSLAAYGLRSKLAFTKEKPAAWTWKDFVAFASKLPVDAIEPTSYYFADRTPEQLAELKRLCTRHGLSISGTAVRNDFCILDDAKLQEQINHVNEWTDALSILGGQTIRIFAGNLPKGARLDQVQKRCIQAIEACCAYASKRGIIIALENHGGITAVAEEMLQLVHGVKSPNFGVNLDTGNFQTDDPYRDLAKLAPYAVTVQVKTEIQIKGQPKQPADIERKLKMLFDNHYRGYVVLEYEAAEDPMNAIPREVKKLRSLINESHQKA